VGASKAVGQFEQRIGHGIEGLHPRYSLDHSLTQTVRVALARPGEFNDGLGYDFGCLAGAVDYS
jgi:hypothetical protein